MKTKRQKKATVRRTVKRPVAQKKKTITRAAEPLATRVHQPRRKWRKPFSYFLNRCFNFDPYRDFGILDELLGGLFVFILIATTITVIFGKEIDTAWVDSSSTDWAKGEKANVEISGTGATASLALKGEDGGWTTQQTVAATNITAIAMLDASSGWAVGEGGKIFRTSDGGTSWQSVANAAETKGDNLWGVAFADTSFGFAVGDNGTILKWNGSAWNDVESETSLTLLSIALGGRQNGIAVGEGGTILEWNGTKWNLVDPSPTDKFLSGVTISGDRAFAVGERGTIMTWDGVAWSEVQQSLTTKNLLAVKLLSPSFGIAVGEGGTILHWNGSSWAKKKGSGPDINSIAIAGGSAAVAGGSGGTIVRWDGSGWNTESANTAESILGIAASGAGKNVAVGSAGFVATYTGTTYAAEGTYTSEIKDAEKEVNGDTIQWSDSAPAGTAVRFQVAANNNKTVWVYLGPDGTTSTYYTNSNGQKLSADQARKRYFRYRAYFKTTDANATPVLHAATLHTKEQVADEPPPQKDEPKPIDDTKKPTTEIPPPAEPTPPPSPAEAPTIPASPSAPSAQTSESSGGGFTERVVSTTLLRPGANALLQTDALTLEWSAVPGATSYNLEVDRDGSFAFPLFNIAVPTSSFTPTPFLPSGSYFWRVSPQIAETATERGDWSSSATFTLTDKPPLPKVASAILTKPIAVDSGTVTLEGIAFPRATVRIIITSNIVEKTVIADENGAWHIDVDRALFTSGQHIAQAQIFSAEGQVAPAITIGEFFIPFPPPPAKNAAVATARAIGAGAVRAADATKKAAKKTVEETVIVAAQTEKVIQENKTETQVALGAAVPVVTVANPTVLPMLSNLHLLFYHFISGVLSLFGLKRKRRPWGIVYDTITKEPIGLAIVRLFDATSKKLLETQVTDDGGRFGFLVQPSSYTLEVVKQDFAYPSKLITGKTDGDYEECYRGETLATKEGAINVSVPLDPLNRKEARKKQPIGMMAKSIMHTLALPLLIIGWAGSWLTVLFAYSVTNLGMTFIYLFFAIVHVVLLPKKFRPWGTVFSAGTLEPVPLAVISIIDAKFNRVMKTRLTDYSGRFNFLPPAGEYKLTVKKEGFDFPSKSKPVTHKFRNLYFGQNIIVKKEKAIVSTDVPVEKK